MPEDLIQVLLATSNPHKLDEARAILRPHTIEVLDLGSHSGEISEPVEDGLTFEDNARLKARYYAHHTGRICLADDSGLEVDALDGRPGVHSARFAGCGETRAERDAANNAKLLKMIEERELDDPFARFVCCLCMAAPDGKVLAETRGTFEGVITREPRGSNGFGYDPLLFLPDVGCTSAELDSSVKNDRSHRGAALRQLAHQLPDLIASGMLPG